MTSALDKATELLEEKAKTWHAEAIASLKQAEAYRREAERDDVCGGMVLNSFAKHEERRAMLARHAAAVLTQAANDLRDLAVKL